MLPLQDKRHSQEIAFGGHISSVDCMALQQIDGFWGIFGASGHRTACLLFSAFFLAFFLLLPLRRHIFTPCSATCATSARKPLETTTYARIRHSTPPRIHSCGSVLRKSPDLRGPYDPASLSFYLGDPLELGSRRSTVVRALVDLNFCLNWEALWRRVG